MSDSRGIDIAGLVVNIAIALAAIYSAWMFQGQLEDARKVTKASTEESMQEERAWVEIEPIKPALLVPPSAKFSATFTCDIYPKNVGKTVARDIVVKAEDIAANEDFGANAAQMHSTQDKMLLGGFTESGTNKPVIVPSNPVPKVLAPNSISPAPFRLTCQAPQVFSNGHQWIHYMIGRIDYSDQFQVKHWLKFCFYVVNARGEVWACQEGNDEDRNEEKSPPES